MAVRNKMALLRGSPAMRNGLLLQAALGAASWSSVAAAAPAAAPTGSLALIKLLREKSGAPITDVKVQLARPNSQINHTTCTLAASNFLIVYLCLGMCFSQVTLMQLNDQDQKCLGATPYDPWGAGVVI